MAAVTLVLRGVMSQKQPPLLNVVLAARSSQNLNRFPGIPSTDSFGNSKLVAHVAHSRSVVPATVISERGDI
jgi:hypothetical protein